MNELKMCNSKLVCEVKRHDKPIVSIVIPTYRRHEILLDAINSALKQDTEYPIEVVVVDNDPESLFDVINNIDFNPLKHNFKYYVNEDNVGMFGNWNQCIFLAEGEWVSILHDDDWIVPEFVTEMLRYIEGGKEILVCEVVVGGAGYGEAGFKEIDLLARKKNNKISTTTLNVDDMIMGTPSPAPGYLIRKDAFLKVGGFTNVSYPCGDYETYIRLFHLFGILKINRKMAYYRIMDNQTFKDDTLKLMISDSYKIKKELFKSASFFSFITYLKSMMFWFELAKKNEINFDLNKYESLFCFFYFVPKNRFVFFVVDGVRFLMKKMKLI